MKLNSRTWSTDDKVFESPKYTIIWGILQEEGILLGGYLTVKN